MGELPSGSVTFVFTDIEGSTALFRRIGDRFGAVLDRHRELIRAALAEHGGAEVKTEGDGFFLAFGSETAAVRFCAAAQRAFAAEPWPDDAAVRVRMGMHNGATAPVDDDYVDLSVHQAARVAAAAHGGQVLLTRAVLDRAKVADLADDVAPARLGTFRLKDFPEPTELFELRGDGLPAGFPAVRAVPAAAHNVPVILTSFVGRENELLELAQIVRHQRVVTVAGAGGAGKTRLVFELTSLLAPEYADGAWVVLLAALEDAAGLPARIAQAVGVPEEPALPIIETLKRQLANRTMLLVLDNCEHLIDAVAAVVDELLAACDGLTVLATSQEPLRLASEHVWRLPPLGLPAGDTVNPETLADVDAVRLFVDRAQACRPDFVLDNSTAGPLAGICRQLDGIPLAIELAAARLRHLDVAEVEARLVDRLRLLTGGGRDAPERQRTLRATVEWSHSLLSEQEQLLFRRLSVFRSRFSLAAAEQVCTDDVLPEWDMLDRLADLVDKSLVSLADDSHGLRYRMLATLREFAAEMLAAAGEEPTFRKRHAEWIWSQDVVQGFRAGPFGRTADDVAFVRAIQDDLRAAFDWRLAQGHSEEALELAAAWGSFVFHTGRYRQGRPWCERALELAEVDGDSEARMRTRYLAGLLALCDGDTDTGRSHGAALLETASRRGDSHYMSRAHHVLGDIALLGRDHQTAREHYQAALELPQASPTSTPVLLRSLGDVAGIAGDVAEQEAAYRDALSQVIAIGSTFEMARTRVALGWLLTGRVSAEAIDVLRAGWQDALDVGAAGAAVAAAAGLGVLAVNQRRPVDGVLLVAAAEAYGQRHGTSVTGALNDYFGLDRVLEAALTQARSELGDSTYAEAWRRGAAGDVADVIAEIYGEVISARPL